MGTFSCFSPAKDMLWSATVTKDKPLTMEAPFDLRITGVCLGKDAKPGNRVFLTMTHEDWVEEEPRTTPICALTAGSTENAILDLVLDESEPVSFSVSGDVTLHLSGYFVAEDGDDEDEMLEQMGMYDEEDSEEDDTFEPASMDSMDHMIDSEDDEEDDDLPPKIEEIEEDILAKVREKQIQAAKKRKEAPSPSTPTPSPAKKKPEASPKKSPKTPTRKQNLKGGTVAEIITPGKGSVTAARGNKVTVRYVGRLVKGGKQFDAGKFSFKLGKGDVIKGMDIGVEGMLVNEKRKLTIPAAQAYGSQRMGDIPANSALEFEVTLLRAQ